MELSKIITADRIRIPIAASDKQGVILELVNLLAATGGLSETGAALEAVLKREAERTTGIGYGLAIPHGKSDACERLLIAAGKPAKPVDFQSLDGRPVTFVVLLISPPNQTGPHIQALAKISRLMNLEEFRTSVDNAQSAQQLHQAIVQVETRDGTARM